jgi:hypothetical protein
MVNHSFDDLVFYNYKFDFIFIGLLKKFIGDQYFICLYINEVSKDIVGYSLRSS